MQNPSNPGTLTADEKMWAMFSHFGFIIGGFLTPLIIWQVKKSESPFIVANAKNALNWSLSLMVIMFALVLLMVIAMFAGGINAMPFVMIFFYIIIFAVAITNVVVSLMAGLKANKGEVGMYPFGIKFVK
jgi:uncharacterized Tic20 family protein